MGFENNAIRELDNMNPGEHPVIEKMHGTAIEILSKNAFCPEDFSDTYNQEMIDDDLAHVEKLKSKFEDSEIKRAADVLEAILYLHSEQSNWLGPNVETMRPSEYDDYVNGVDLISEFTTEDTTSHLALGVDITFASESLGNKFTHIKNEIDNDNLAEVKYFESHGFKGRLRQLPRIVIGVEKNTVLELAGLWMNRKNNELAKHPVKLILLTEILEQLRAYRDYAERNGKEKALKSYKQALAVVQDLEKDIKSSSREDREHIDTDRVCSDIRANLRIKFGKEL